MENIETIKCPICTSYETTSDHKGKCRSSLINHATLMHGVNRKKLRGGCVNNTSVAFGR